MNQYLASLLDLIAIDINHLKSKFLNDSELTYLNEILKSEQNFKLDFYTNNHGENLECLLMFLTTQKQKIIDFKLGKSKDETLIELYTSGAISGSYDCFRFNLSKFPQIYIPNNKVISIYRIGRNAECEGNLGCSWARSIDGLNAYCDASGVSKVMLNSRPIFFATIDDSQVLFEGKKVEHELVLKPNFKYHTLDNIDDKSRLRIGR